MDFKLETTMLTLLEGNLNGFCGAMNKVQVVRNCKLSTQSCIREENTYILNAKQDL
jgi:hypothetical protein